MVDVKRISAAFLAVAVCLALCACSGGEDKPNEPGSTASGADSSGESCGLQTGSNESLNGEEAQPEEEASAVEMISVKLSENGIALETGEETAAEQEYGKQSSVAMELPNGDMIVVTTFESEDAAKTYSGYYNESGDIFNDGEQSMVIDYIAPVHFWQHGRYIIEYCSATGEELYLLNELFGNEFAGAGSDFYYPEYAYELYDALGSAGYSYDSSRVFEMQQLYMYQQDSMCEIELDSGETISLRWFSDESKAKDHVSRFSPDGESYTGFAGSNRTSIDLGRQEPLRVFRKGGVAAEYSGDDPNVLSVLESVYGAQLVPYEADGPVDLQYEARLVRTDCNIGGVSYPQYAIVRSVEELNEYVSGSEGMYNLSENPGWLAATGIYDEGWFKDNDLILITLSESSGSVSHVVNSVVKNTDGSYCVTIERIEPEISTDDMAQWHVLISVSEGKLYPLADVDVVIA